MRAFADAYQDEQFVQQVVAQILWGHKVRILDYVKDYDERIWYIRKTIKNGWSPLDYFCRTHNLMIYNDYYYYRLFNVVLHEIH